MQFNTIGIHHSILQESIFFIIVLLYYLLRCGKGVALSLWLYPSAKPLDGSNSWD